MKLIWHIIKKDFVRDRRAILLWAALYVVQVAIGIVARQSGDPDPELGVRLQLTSVGLVLLQAVAAYILVARLVHADGLLGTTGFWNTRPISATRLFTAKALGVLLIFGMLPVAVLLPWWLYCGFGWREVLLTGVETLGWQLLVIAPAFLVASLTDDLGRVLLWTLLLVVGVLSWVVLLQASFGWMSERPSNERVGPGIMYTKLWLSALVMIAGGFAVGGHQFLTRRFVRSVVGLACVLGLVAAIGLWGRWNWARGIASLHRPPPAGTPEMTDAIEVEFESAGGNFGEPASRRGVLDGKDAMVVMRLRTRGVAEGNRLATASANHTWTWRDGTQLSRAAFYDVASFPEGPVLRKRYSLSEPEKDEESERWHAAQRDRTNERRRARGEPAQLRLSMPKGDEAPMLAVLAMPNSLLAKMKADAPAFQLELGCILSRPEVVAELPLRDDARASGGGYKVRLRYPSGGRPLLVITQSSVADLGLWYSAMHYFNYRYRSWRSIKAVNRVTGDVTSVLENQQGSQHLQIAGVLINWNIIHIRTPQLIRGGKEVEADPQWAEHTTLAVMVDRELARFRREVAVEKFLIE